mmetsp:Transcript_34972/g.100387  ORF Transcript_34972/g.100387 Transcript_34972/m.100387 type:complete len:247 (-) Transcript_34972:698-1438(-)
MASGRQPICSISRLAPSAIRAFCASGGSSELARVEADSSLSTTPPHVPDAEAAGEAANTLASETNSGARRWLPQSGASAQQSTRSRPSARSATSTSAMLAVSSAPPAASSAASESRNAMRPPFLARPFLSRPRGPTGGSSAACSSCCKAAQANSRQSEAPTCAWARTRRRCASKRSRKSHRSQHRSSRCAASAVRMCAQAPERARPGGGSSGAHSTSSRTSDSWSGTTRTPRSSAVRRCAIAEPSS